MTTAAAAAAASAAADADVVAVMETNENVRFVFDLLDSINKRIGKSHPNDGLDFLSILEIQELVNNHVRMKDIQLSNHGQRLIHFILYLNTEIENCSWIKEDPILNLNRYVHGKPISSNVYCKVVEILDLKPYMAETIMSTPYCFNCDLVDIALNKIKDMDGLPQLSTTEDLIISLLKSIKRLPVKYDLETQLNSHFNQAMTVFAKDHIPYDMNRLHYETEQKILAKYNGFRVKSIFKIFTEVIKFNSNPDTYRQYPMYKLKSLRNSESTTDIASKMFKNFFDVIMHKCMNMCDFSIDTWLSWYEVEVVEDDTNLQAAIGHLCYDLCTFIDNGSVNENFLKEFRPILSNMAIEKIDFTNVDINDIDGMIDRVEHCPKFHLNDWIKKMIENTDVFANSRAIQTLDNFIDCVDYNCFKTLIDQCMIYYKSGGIMFESLGKVIYKGIEHLDLEDKTIILKHIIVSYPDNMFYFTNEFDDELRFIAINETNDNIQQKELLSKLILLVLQQPKKMLHMLISQYVNGIYGLPAKTNDSKKLCLHQVLVFMHLYLEPNYIYSEYNSWLDFESVLPVEKQNRNIFNWILIGTKNLHLLKPKIFLANVMAPLLVPSLNYDHMLFLINITKFLLTECQLMTLPDIDLWDTLLTRLAKVLDDARWTIETYSTIRVEVCENVILCLQPLLHFAVFIVKPTDLESVKNELSSLHLLTRCHLVRLWSSEFLEIEGLDEHFIMTIQSQHHISFSNLNKSSKQGLIEEFIFSIATYMPKFTSLEMKNFVTNYLSSAKAENITDASFFLMDCVMNAFMRIIVYLKTATQNDPCSDENSWDYLGNTIVNFLDNVNTSRMCSIYHEDLIEDVKVAFNSVTKIITVIKQLKNTRQLPLLVIIRRIIHVIITRLDVESISKLLTLLASIKTKNSKDTLENTVETLISKLNANPSLT